MSDAAEVAASFDIELAENVRVAIARKDRRVTQKAIAEVLDLSEPQVSRRLKGRVPFKAWEVLAVAAMLGVDWKDLVPARLKGFEPPTF